jgi:hypothetical protein
VCVFEITGVQEQPYNVVQHVRLFEIEKLCHDMNNKLMPIFRNGSLHEYTNYRLK